MTALLSSPRSVFSAGIVWREPAKENRLLAELAGQVAELARASGLSAELRPPCGAYRPALVLEDGQSGCVVHFEYGQGSVHLATCAWLVQVTRTISQLRGRDYIPVLCSPRRLYGATARFAYDEGVLFIDADTSDPARAAQDVAWTIGFSS